MAKNFQASRGTRDLLPEETRIFDYVLEKFITEAKRSGYGRIETPIFEDTELFTRGVGGDTDIVEKEMYTFKDKSDNSITLRPEGTASVVRSYLERGMQSWPKPVNVYYYGPMFRYDRPQAGRYRQFTQFGLEAIGVSDGLYDASMIALFWRVLENLNMEDLSLQINNIGCPICRPKYKKILVSYLQDHTKKLCEDCNRRMIKNPLRVLDCKNKACQAIADEAPAIVNNLCKECHDHFANVLEWLDELDIAYEINPKLVRGLDYYTKTVFEVWSNENKGQNTLIAGGRYDGLIEILGGKKTPAVGFAAGVDRIVEEIVKKGVKVDIEKDIDVFVAQIGEPAKKKGFKLLYDLQKEGIGARAGLDKGGISEQLKIASKLGVYFTLIIGQKEALSDTVIIKDMQSGNQDTYPIDKVVKEVKKRLKGLKG